MGSNTLHHTDEHLLSGPAYHSALGISNGAGLQGVIDGAFVIAQCPSGGPTHPPSVGTNGAAVFAQDPSWGPTPSSGALIEQL